MSLDIIYEYFFDTINDMNKYNDMQLYKNLNIYLKFIEELQKINVCNDNINNIKIKLLNIYENYNNLFNKKFLLQIIKKQNILNEFYKMCEFYKFIIY
jgi:hypothetical protein